MSGVCFHALPQHTGRVACTALSEGKQRGMPVGARSLYLPARQNLCPFCLLAPCPNYPKHSLNLHNISESPPPSETSDMLRSADKIPVKLPCHASLPPCFCAAPPSHITPSLVPLQHSKAWGAASARSDAMLAFCLLNPSCLESSADEGTNKVYLLLCLLSVNHCSFLFLNLAEPAWLSLCA